MKVAAAYLKVLKSYSCKEAEENHRKPQSELQVTQPIFEQGTSQI
jgi:hypothetical protein